MSTTIDMLFPTGQIWNNVEALYHLQIMLLLKAFS